MVAVARQTGHPFSFAMAHYFAAMAHQAGGAATMVKKLAETAMAQADREGFEILYALAIIPHGWAIAELGQAEEGIGEIRRGLELYPSPLVQPWSRSLLVDALVRNGEHRAALEALAEALSMMERTGERWWEVELLRLRGESLAGQGADAGEVESCFRPE
jgi:hypothetical protein